MGVRGDQGGKTISLQWAHAQSRRPDASQASEAPPNPPPRPPHSRPHMPSKASVSKGPCYQDWD